MGETMQLRTRSALMLAAVFALLAAIAAPVGAQDGPTAEIDPLVVPAAGEQELNATGSGWQNDPAILPCPGLNGDESAFTIANSQDVCDVSAFVIPALEDGAFETPLTFDVPAEGLVVLVADQATLEFVLITVTVEGAADDSGDTGAEEAGTEELANTGAETGALLVIAASLLVAGLLFTTSRRHFV